MSKIWVPPQAERYTEKKLLTAARELKCYEIKPRTIRTFEEIGLLAHRQRTDWPGDGGGSPVGWWPRPQFDLWLALLRQRKGIIAREGYKAQMSAALCNVVVAAWLYFGEAGGIPLTQARQAMRTWANANSTVRSYTEAQRLAREFIRKVAQPSATDRRELRKYLADMLFSGNYPDREELLYKIGTLVDPKNRCEIKGPAQAPISAVNITDMILGRAEALGKVRKKDAETPDGLWEWAHFMLLWSVGSYLADESRIAQDPSLKKYPELAQMYAPQSIETLVNLACEDLLTAIGTATLASAALHLPAECRPDPWLAGQLQLRVDGRAQLSALLHPDGTRQAYLGMAVQVSWVSPPSK